LPGFIGQNEGMNDLFHTLVDRTRHTAMTPEAAEAQRRSFAFGNANIENDRVTRDVVDAAAERLHHDAAR
jgi:hypothetical protein